MCLVLEIIFVYGVCLCVCPQGICVFEAFADNMSAV